MVSPICSRVAVTTRESDQRKRAHASSNMQDNRSVYWNAFITKKFPSTSHAARMKSKDRSEENRLNGGPTCISSHHEAPSSPTLRVRLISGSQPTAIGFRHLLTLVHGVRRVGYEQREVPRIETVRWGVGVG